MSGLSSTRLAELLQPYIGPDLVLPPDLYQRLSSYLELLLRWNARTNLTAIREPEEIVRRHFGESLFAGWQLTPYLSQGSTLLDFGSGAGFPGLPIQLLLPNVRVCLAESQGKKSSFLREAARTLGLETEIWAGRAETMPIERSFDCVTLRSVDSMESAIGAAGNRVGPFGLLALLEGKGSSFHVDGGWETLAEFILPESHSRQLRIMKRLFHVEQPS